MGYAFLGVVFLGLQEDAPNHRRDTGLSHVLVVEDEDVAPGRHLFFIYSFLFFSYLFFSRANMFRTRLNLFRTCSAYVPHSFASVVRTRLALAPVVDEQPGLIDGINQPNFYQLLKDVARSLFVHAEVIRHVAYLWNFPLLFLCCD